MAEQVVEEVMGARLAFEGPAYQARVFLALVSGAGLVYQAELVFREFVFEVLVFEQLVFEELVVEVLVVEVLVFLKVLVFEVEWGAVVGLAFVAQDFDHEVL